MLLIVGPTLPPPPAVAPVAPAVAPVEPAVATAVAAIAPVAPVVAPTPPPSDEPSLANTPYLVPGVSVEVANPRGSDQASSAPPAPAAPRARAPQPPARSFIKEAIVPAQRSQAATGVPASVTIAQAILESDWGRSGLATRGYNYFGIKATTRGGSMGAISMDTDEVFGGQRVTIKDEFRRYSSMEESFTDHGRFFVENRRYAAALKVSNDPRAFAREIQKAGYATDPNYADKLIAIMEQNNLFQYDLRPLPA